MIGNGTISAFAAAMSVSGLLFTVSDGFYTRLQSPPIEGSAVYSGAVRPGETVVIPWHIVKRVDCHGQNARVWDGVDGFSLSETFRPVSLPVGNRTYNVPTTIPAEAPPGALSLTIRGFYECVAGKPEWFALGPVNLKVVDW